VARHAKERATIPSRITRNRRGPTRTRYERSARRLAIGGAGGGASWNRTSDLILIRDAL
jgi:hypothetical protein